MAEPPFDSFQLGSRRAEPLAGTPPPTLHPAKPIEQRDERCGAEGSSDEERGIDMSARAVFGLARSVRRNRCRWRTRRRTGYRSDWACCRAPWRWRADFGCRASTGGRAHDRRRSGRRCRCARRRSVRQGRRRLPGNVRTQPGSMSCGSSSARPSGCRTPRLSSNSSRHRKGSPRCFRASPQRVS